MDGEAPPPAPGIFEDGVLPIREAQHLIDAAFDRFTDGLLSREEYADEVDRICGTIRLPEHLARRLDERTPGAFALHVYDCTVRERDLMRRWVALRPNADKLTFVDAGIANDGRFILEPSRPTGTPDFYVFDGHRETPVEVKYCPTDKFVTYREADLRRCLEDDVLILTFIQKEGLPLLWFALSGESIAMFLACGERGNHKGFGGKPTVRLLAQNFGDIVRPKAMLCKTNTCSPQPISPVPTAPSS